MSTVSLGVAIAGCVLAFALGAALGLLLAGSRRRLARELLARQEARWQTETEALLDGVKSAFAEVSTNSLRQAADELMRLSQASLGAERRIQGQQVAAERAEFEARIGVVLAQLERMQALIRDLERDRSQKFGELGARLDAAGREAQALVAHTRTLAAALGNARVRGQWGERMADDILRLAGFVENVNFRKQAVTARGVRPDVTFLLPHGRVLHMDVKFPFENWAKLVEAGDEIDKTRAAAAFIRDVRGRIAEVADRGYVAPAEGTLDFAILFIPNEQIMAAAFELEPGLLDDCLRRAVVPASPATLFAVLAVIRQSVDSFQVAEAAREIGGLLAGFREAWTAYLAESDSVAKALAEAQIAFDRLRGLRARKLDQKLAALDELTARGASADAPSPCDGQGR